MNETRRVTIVGFGLMGAQIAQVFAEKGYFVFAYDVDRLKLDSGLALIREGRFGLEKGIEKGKLDTQKAKRILESIETTGSIDYALAGAELVLEAAFEDLKVKKEIMQKAAGRASPNAILASNTSTLSITKIAEGLPSEAGKRIIGLHFFNPPQVMKLVEIIRTKETSPEIISKAAKVAASLGKISVNILDYPGFVANRIGLTVYAEASSLLEKGIANVRDIDISMRLGYGYPMGPFELGDLVGLDSRLRNMEAMYSETGDEKFKPPEILRKLVADGYFGDPNTKQGSKGGYYEYFKLKRPSEDST